MLNENENINQEKKTWNAGNKRCHNGQGDSQGDGKGCPRTGAEHQTESKQSTLDQHDPEERELSSPKSLLLFYYLLNLKTPSGELGADSYVHLICWNQRYDTSDIPTMSV